LTNPGSSWHRFDLLLFVDVALWVAVIAAAIYAAYTGLTDTVSRNSSQDYMWGYVTLSFVLSPILAVVLFSPFTLRLGGRRLGSATVALPTLLLAVLLHIAAWGVSASAWLADISPRIGGSLWIFVQICVPLAIGLCGSYLIKVMRALRSQVQSGGMGSIVRPRETWYIVASLLLILQFIAIAAGSALTATSVNHPWFTEEAAVWTQRAVLVTVSFMVVALVVSARVTSRDYHIQTALSVPGTEDGAGQKALASHSGSKTGNPAWKIVLGPLVVSALLYIISLAVFLFPQPLITDFRLSIATVLFVAYGSSLLPSYVTVCILRLVRVRESSRAIGLDGGLSPTLTQRHF
jgi:hypothetical protein